MENIPSFLGTAVSVLCAVLIAAEFFLGLRRGIFNTLINKIFMAVACVAAFLCAPVIGGKLAADGTLSFIPQEYSWLFCESGIKEKIIELTSGLDGIGEEIFQSPVLSEAIKKVPSFLSASLILPVVCAAFSAVALVLYLIFKKPIASAYRGNETDPKKSKMFSAIIGTAISLFIFAVSVSPLSGIASAASDFAPVFDEITEVCEEYSSKPAPAVFSALGFDSFGEKYLDSASEYTVNRKGYHLTRDLECTSKLLSVMKQKGVFDASEEELTSFLSDKELLSAVSDATEGSKALDELEEIILKRVVKSIIKNVMKDFSFTDEEIDNFADNFINKLEKYGLSLSSVDDILSSIFGGIFK